MNLYGGYGTDLSLYDFGFSDPSIFEFSRNSPILSHSSSTSITAYYDNDEPPRPSPKKKNTSPPKHRHDGTSPLPLGMDWSPSPRIWVGTVIFSIFHLFSLWIVIFPFLFFLNEIWLVKALALEVFLFIHTISHTKAGWKQIS